jgi:hypothetical protein
MHGRCGGGHPLKVNGIGIDCGLCVGVREYVQPHPCSISAVLSVVCQPCINGVSVSCWTHAYCATVA